MTGGDLAKMYEISYGAINRNLEDVSNDESLVHPVPGGNCLNWVLGHVVVYRGMMMKMVGLAPVFDGDRTVPYQRGSRPDGTERYLDLATLRGLLSDAHQQLIPALSEMTNEELARNVPEEFNRAPLAGSIGNALARLSFHESYHAGQIGLLRRIAGKEGAIR
jgi:DinB superfamily